MAHITTLTVALGAIALETQRVIAIGTNDSVILETGFALVTSLAQLSESVDSV
jgi:deoxycytidylate deaminase